MAGWGASRSRFFTSSDESRGEVSGIGPSFTTSVGYCGHDAACLEFGSLVSFNYYDNMRVDTSAVDTAPFQGDVNMWETTFYLAMRSRFPGITPSPQLDPWFKLMAGYGASVGFLQKIESPGYEHLKHHRVQTEGPLMGLSVTNIFQGSKRYRHLWFIEGSAILQMHWKTWLVAGDGLLPEVTTSEVQRNPYSLLLNLSVGIRIF